MGRWMGVMIKGADIKKGNPRVEKLTNSGSFPSILE